MAAGLKAFGLFATAATILAPSRHRNSTSSGFPSKRSILSTGLPSVSSKMKRSRQLPEGAVPAMPAYLIASVRHTVSLAGSGAGSGMSSGTVFLHELTRNTGDKSKLISVV